MAESQSMTSAGVVAKALIEEHSDFLRESVAMIAAEIMEAEIGARRGEATSSCGPTARTRLLASATSVACVSGSRRSLPRRSQAQGPPKAV
jgi:hypothetical protein